MKTSNTARLVRACLALAISAPIVSATAGSPSPARPAGAASSVQALQVHVQDLKKQVGDLKASTPQSQIGMLVPAVQNVRDAMPPSKTGATPKPPGEPPALSLQASAPTQQGKDGNRPVESLSLNFGKVDAAPPAGHEKWIQIDSYQWGEAQSKAGDMTLKGSTIKENAVPSPAPDTVGNNETITIHGNRTESADKLGRIKVQLPSGAGDSSTALPAGKGASSLQTSSSPGGQDTATSVIRKIGATLDAMEVEVAKLQAAGGKAGTKAVFLKAEIRSLKDATGKYAEAPDSKAAEGAVADLSQALDSFEKRLNALEDP